MRRGPARSRTTPRRTAPWHAPAAKSAGLVIAPLQIALRRRDRDGHAAVPPAGSSLARGQPARARSPTGHLPTEGVKPSIGPAGLACDSTLTESINGPLKTECIRAAVAGRFGPPGRVGEQPSDLGDGERDEAGVGGRRGIGGAAGGGAWVSVRSRSIAAVTAQIATAAMTSTMCRRIAV